MCTIHVASWFGFFKMSCQRVHVMSYLCFVVRTHASYFFLFALLIRKQISQRQRRHKRKGSGQGLLSDQITGEKKVEEHNHVLSIYQPNNESQRMLEVLNNLLNVGLGARRWSAASTRVLSVTLGGGTISRPLGSISRVSGIISGVGGDQLVGVFFYFYEQGFKYVLLPPSKKKKPSTKRKFKFLNFFFKVKRTQQHLVSCWEKV